ncbi:MAG TPA: 50S ribosomal protein L11 [Phycisphaerae bacterium]|nr:50S ribosomal protein L11 [Phycisphaerae bacterium]HOB75871.1 50S ribosomal protein L11 [Phycisphaerae bacterium]HOJ55672.1 50S ribosomal protein L11 [Phycisphaerae bacterium]HOL26654.1 50S ribosomal protein L11 [Phycisphaerae bacterium]HPP20597.1 50S ribosomal protein L11 [Phycisphaerae bacterium]
MAKEILTKVKLQAPGGSATPAPPIGPALGQHGVNIGQFVKMFNDQTRELNGMIVPVEITIYKDKSFTFIVKSPPAAVLLKEAAQIAKGSGVPNKEKVGKVTWSQVRKISERKQKDLNAFDLDHADRIIAGTARSMGIEIVEG